MFVVGAGYDVKFVGESFSAGMRKKGAASPLVLQFCVQRWFACRALRQPCCLESVATSSIWCTLLSDAPSSHLPGRRSGRSAAFPGAVIGQ